MPQLPDLSALGSILRLFVAGLGAYLFALWIAMERGRTVMRSRSRTSLLISCRSC